MQLATHADHVVCLVCFSKQLEKQNRFVVVLECCLHRFVDQRKRFWVAKGYQDQGGNDELKTFKAKSKQAFTAVFQETRNDPRYFNLEYHRKRDNVITFEVELKGRSAQYTTAKLVVENKHGPVDDPSKSDSNPLASFEVNLILSQYDFTQPKPLITVTQVANNRGQEESVPPKSARMRNVSSPNTYKPKSASSNRGAQNQTQQDGIARLQATLNKAMNNIDPIELKEDEQLAPVEPEKPVDPDLKYLSNNVNAGNDQVF